MSGFRLKISLLAYLLAVGLTLYGQESPQSITLDLKDRPMREVLDRIEEQTGLSFSYNSRLIDEEELIRITLVHVALEEALDLLFAGRRIAFEVVEQQIVLVRARRVQFKVEASLERDSTGAVPVRFTVSGYVKDSRSGEVLIGATITIPGGAQGTITNSYGFYSLTLQREVQELYCTYVGYRTRTIGLGQGENQILAFYDGKGAFSHTRSDYLLRRVR